MTTRKTPRPKADGGPDVPPGNAGFDQLLTQLREVVEKLETGDLSLEQALAAYEQGVGLARQGQEVLDGAEQRVELLMNGPDGITRAPLATAADDDDDDDDTDA